MLMMFPFEPPMIFEGIHKSYFRMPRVVKDQKGKYENDELFRQLSHESIVRYTAFKDRPLEERQVKFITGCQEGHTEISVVQSGNQFILTFNPSLNPAISGEGCDFDKELGKVHIKSPFILNGVCVVWRGYIDLQRLDGSGCLEFDECRAYIEEHASKFSLETNEMKPQIHQAPPPPITQQQIPIPNQQQICNNNSQNNMNNHNNIIKGTNTNSGIPVSLAAPNIHPGSPLGLYANYHHLAYQHHPSLGPPGPPMQQGPPPPVSLANKLAPPVSCMGGSPPHMAAQAQLAAAMVFRFMNSGQHQSEGPM